MCKTKIGVLEMVFLDKWKTHNLNNEKAKKRTYLKDETKINGNNLWNKVFKCNILMLFFSLKQKRKKARQEKSTKKNKVKIKTRQQEGKKQKRKRIDRERERVTKRSERSQRERKRDTEKWTKITLCQGEKQCFCKKTPKNPQKKKGWRPTAQKHTCNAALPPFPRRMRTKMKNSQRKRGGCEEDHFRFAKTGSTKKNRKTRKNPPHRSREAIFERDPKSTEKNDTAAHLPRAKFARAADTLPKIRFSKRARFCSPRGFLTFETQFRQNFEHRTVQNSNLRKKLSSRQVRKMEPFRRSISRFSRRRQFSAKNGHPSSHCKTSGFGRPGPLINSSRAAY